MLDSILSSLTDAVTQKIDDDNEPDFNLPKEKMDDAFSLAKDSILNEFLNKADEDDDEENEGGFASVLNLFNGKKEIGSSSLVDNIATKYGAQLIEKLGVSENMSHAVASYIVPKVLDQINNDTPDEGLQKNDLLSLFGDKAVDALKSKGGVGSLIGGLFG